MAGRLERFDSRVYPDPNSGCWLWGGFVTSQGYGRILVDRKCVSAHRFSFERHKGTIPKGMVVRHRCDTPVCVNPLHLELGTQADNVADMARRSRAQKKLSVESVREIRASDESGIALAEKHCVSRSMVSRIKNNHSRKYV